MGTWAVAVYSEVMWGRRASRQFVSLSTFYINFMLCPDLSMYKIWRFGFFCFFLFLFFPIIKQLRGAEGMAYQLRSLAALPEDLGLIPGTPNCL